MLSCFSVDRFITLTIVVIKVTVCDVVVYHVV